MAGRFCNSPKRSGVSFSGMDYTVASIDTRCIDSNLESGRYISRVGRASSFLSLYGTYGTVGTYGTAVPTVPTVLLHMTLYCC